MYLNPEPSFGKNQFVKFWKLIEFLQDHKVLIETPRLILDNPFHIWIVIKDKKYNMISHIPNFKTIC